MKRTVTIFKEKVYTREEKTKLMNKLKEYRSRFKFSKNVEIDYKETPIVNEDGTFTLLEGADDTFFLVAEEKGGSSLDDLPYCLASEVRLNIIIDDGK